jgi:hypothetical protein
LLVFTRAIAPGLQELSLVPPEDLIPTANWEFGLDTTGLTVQHQYPAA